MPADFSDVFSNHLKALDLPPGRKYRLTIVDARVESFAKFGAGQNEPKQKKLVVSFSETGKDLVCSATNARILSDAFGADTANLLGKRVVLDTYSTNMGMALRVAIPTQPAQERAGDPFAQPAQQQQRTRALVDSPQQPVGNSASASPSNAAPTARDADFDDPIPF